MDLKAALAEMMRRPGVSGYEGEVASYIGSVFQGYCREVRTDPLGNLIGFRPGEGEGRHPRVMLAAHMDQIGLMVTTVEENGFLRFTQVGGFDPRILLGQEVWVYTRDGVMLGVIGSKPPHLQTKEEEERLLKLEEMYIDVGLRPEEARAKIHPGDLVVLKRELISLQGERVAGLSFDDRAGVLAIFACLDELSRWRHLADVYVVGTVQEEVGLRGAMTSAYGLVPDVGIAIDVTFADPQGLPEGESFPLDEGPTIGIGPHVHPKLQERFVQVAKDLEIKWQLDPMPTPYGTDAWSIQVARSGIPTILLSIPLRYMHTSVEVISLRDVRLLGRLMAGFIAGLDYEFVEGLTCF